MRGGYGALVEACAAARRPPLAPEEVRRLLEHEKKFTAGADVEVVDKLYRAFFEGVTGHATELDFQRLEWGDEEGRQLAAVLPRFAALEGLDLSHNRLGDGAAAALAPALKEMPQLKQLRCAAPAPLVLSCPRTALCPASPCPCAHGHISQAQAALQLGQAAPSFVRVAHVCPPLSPGSLGGNHLTKAGIRAIREAAGPGLDVYGLDDQAKRGACCQIL